MKARIAASACLLVVPASGFMAVGKTALWRHQQTVSRERSSSLIMATRTPIIAANWKENPGTLAEAKALAAAVAAAVKKSKNVEVAVIPPYPFLYPVLKMVGEVPVKLGGQNCYFEEKGAFTGAVSTAMLESIGCEFVLCGHSERRTVFRNEDFAINKKVKKVLEHGMKPILCIGESKGEYEAGLVKAICAIQLAKDLKDVSAEEMMRVVIAYEPVWAIGTGLTATPAIVQSVHAYIRSWLKEKYGAEVADSVRIQYGGSVTPESVDELMACPDVDGALVGGASLDGEKFGRIVNFTPA